MIALVKQHLGTIVSLCRQFRVERLDLFGSAAKGNFDPKSSDLDFLVQFGETSAPGYSDRYYDLAEALETLFGRKVDLTTERSIKNPFFRETVEASRQTIYDSRNEKALA